MLRCTAIWSGFSGAPGYTNFYFSEPVVPGPSAQAIANGVRSFFFNLRLMLPDKVTVTTQATIARINEATGALEGEIQAAQDPGAVQGVSAAAYSGVSGGAISWSTAGIVAGRRVRGRTFVVPLSGDSYQADGTLNEGTLAGLRSAAAALQAVGGLDFADFGVWHRPIAGAGGSYHTVTGFRVADKAAVLRSRRD